jgi:hypothetical protein
MGYLEEHMKEACLWIGIILANHLQQRSNTLPCCNYRGSPKSQVTKQKTSQTEVTESMKPRILC